MRIRKMFFRDHGLVSGLAFPPVIPVLLTSTKPDRFIRLKKNRRKFLPASLSGTVRDLLTERGKTLFYPTLIPDWDELVRSIREFLCKEMSPENTGLTDFYDYLANYIHTGNSHIIDKPGIFMGNKGERPVSVSVTDYPLNISWKNGELVCFWINIDADMNWWEKINFREIVQV